jgi:vitamin B12 transporter
LTNVRIEIQKRCSTWRMHLIVVSFLCLPLVLHDPLMAQEDVPCYTLDPVVVTGSLIPEHLSRMGHTVSVITREEIEALPVDSVADLLETVSGVDIRQRGGHGVQADVAIRGSSFEQTLILVDGVNVSDAQTGHHNLDLPVNLEDVERIEILKGPGARIYGHNAMAGVVNIITRKIDRSALGGHVTYGDHDYCDVGATGTYKTGAVSNRISMSQRSSTGHIPDEATDFDIHTLAYKGAVNTQTQEFLLNLGYTDKDFGAYRFYTDTYPNQRERTDTLLAHGSANLRLTDLEVMPTVFWRRHNDDFKIEIGDDWYRNEHQSDAWGLQLGSRLESPWGIAALGGEIAFEDLESSNLGDHNRHRSGVFFEHRSSPVDRCTFSLGASATDYSDWGWEYWPGVELNVELKDGLHGFASLGRSFRIPTYTELYYNTPANQGNPDLKPERAWTYETGIRWREKGLGANLSLFLRDAQDVIDLTRTSDLDPWKAQNMAENKTQGFELGFDFYPEAYLNTTFVSTVNVSYTYLDSDWDTGGLESKYLLDHLRHQLHGSVILDWLDDLTQTAQVRYEKRMAGDSHVVMDTRLTYKWHKCEIFLEVTNLFDEQYVESGFSPMPGRWIMGGVKIATD